MLTKTNPVEVIAFVDVKPTKKNKGYVRKTETLWCTPGQHSFRRPKVRGVKPNHCRNH